MAPSIQKLPFNLREYDLGTSTFKHVDTVAQREDCVRRPQVLQRSRAICTRTWAARDLRRGPRAGGEQRGLNESLYREDTHLQVPGVVLYHQLKVPAGTLL